MSSAAETIHASAVVVGERAVIIRGASGAGKSRLAARLLDAGKTGLLPYVRLIADDRVKIFAAHGRLLVSAPDFIRGMMEVHGLGIRTVPCEPMAVAGWIVDVAAEDAARMPETNFAELLGVKLPRLAIKANTDAMPILLAALTTAPMG